MNLKLSISEFCINHSLVPSETCIRARVYSCRAAFRLRLHNKNSFWALAPAPLSLCLTNPRFPLFSRKFSTPARCTFDFQFWQLWQSAIPLCGFLRSESSVCTSSENALEPVAARGALIFSNATCHESQVKHFRVLYKS